MRASACRSRPVISQSIQMMRSEEVEELTPVTIAIRPTGDGSDHGIRLPVNYIGRHEHAPFAAAGVAPRTGGGGHWRTPAPAADATATASASAAPEQTAAHVADA